MRQANCRLIAAAAQVLSLTKENWLPHATHAAGRSGDHLQAIERLGSPSHRNRAAIARPIGQSNEDRNK